MSYDVKKLTYQEVTILGKPALFTECRLDRSTVPEGVYRYEIRHADENWGEPIELSRSIVINYYGTVLTREPFQLPVEGWMPLESDSLVFRDGGYRTLAEFQQEYPVSEKDVIDFYSVNKTSLPKEKNKSLEHEVPVALTEQEQREFLALWAKLRPAQKDAIRAFITAMLEE